MVAKLHVTQPNPGREQGNVCAVEMVAEFGPGACGVFATTLPLGGEQDAVPAAVRVNHQRHHGWNNSSGIHLRRKS